jgi:flagellar hook-basal body complex protein FliE
MLSKISSAVAAYTQSAKALQGAVGGPPASQGGDFAAVLAGAAQNVTGTLGKAEAVSMQAVANNADLNAVVTAVTEAEVTLQAAIAIRDKVIQAYNDIAKMPI